jgi:phosphotriesterase-related protein
MDESLIDSSTFEPNLGFLDYHRRCLELGVYVQYDTFGTEWYWDNWNIREPRDSERVAALATLIKEGWEDHLLIAEDVFVKQCLRHYGGWGYDFLVRVVPVMLRQAGVSDEAIDKLLIHNPRRVLTFDQV